MANLKDLIVTGNSTLTGNVSVNNINGVAVGNSPKFTDTQSDWNQTDTEADDYIKNKPTIPDVPSWALEPTKPAYTADEVGALQNREYFYGQVRQNDNNYVNWFADALWAADKRWNVSVSVTNENNETVDPTSYSPGNLFNLNYDGFALCLDKKTTAVLLLKGGEDITDTTSRFFTYGQGAIYVHFYSNTNHLPKTLTGRVYKQYGTAGWINLTFTRLDNPACCYKADITSSCVYPSALELTIVAADEVSETGRATSIVEIEWWTQRQHANDVPLMSKAKSETLFYPLTVKGTVEAAYVKVTGSTNNYVLLGGGGTKALTQFFSGNYNDLTNKPTIPSAAANGTFSIKTKVGDASAVTVSDFTANQSTTDDFTLIQGTNVTLTTNTNDRSVTIASTDTNTATLGVSDVSNRKISTSETSGSYIQFTGGTNKVTVSDGTSSFDVGVTPSITNNVTANGNFAANAIIVGNGASQVAKSSGKTISTTAPSSESGDTTVPTSKAVWTAIGNGIATNDAMVYKGTIAGGSTGSYGALTGAANMGWTYKVSTAGKINGVAVEVGDMIICNTDSTAAATSSNYSTIAASWDVIQTNIDGALFKSSNSFTDGHVLVADSTAGKVKDSGFTIGKSVPSNAVFTDTDTKVTSVDNHYSPTANSNSELTASLSGTAGTFSTNTEYTVLTGVKAQRDAKGHVTGLTYTAQKVKDTTIANTDRYVNSAGFTDDTTGTPASPVKMTLTRAGSDTATVIGNIPKVSSSSAGVAPKGAAVSTQSQSTKFLREDGTWAAPSYTTNTNTTYKLKIGSTTNGDTTNGVSLGVLESKAAAANGTDLSLVTTGEKNTWNNKSNFSGSYNDLTNKPTIPAAQIQSDWNQTNSSSKDFIKNKPTIPTVPTNVSAFTNDAGYLTQHQDISGKQNTLVSGTNIKTVNNESILGSGNISISASAELPSNLTYTSDDNGEGIVPSDGIRAESVAAGATMSINADVVTVVTGTVGTATITLQVPQDNLAHVWDILMTTNSTVAITFAMSNSATILYPDGFSVSASKAVEISVIGVGTRYYLRYGEFA